MRTSKSPTTRRPMATIEEVAEFFQVPIQTVYRWNTRGTGPRPVHVGRFVRYAWDEIDRWVEAGGNTAG
jgi:predicted DNA-binding transcriptional regulator AlpA